MTTLERPAEVAVLPVPAEVSAPAAEAVAIVAAARRAGGAPA